MQKGGENDFKPHQECSKSGAFAHQTLLTCIGLVIFPCFMCYEICKICYKVNFPFGCFYGSLRRASYFENRPDSVSGARASLCRLIKNRTTMYSQCGRAETCRWGLKHWLERPRLAPVAAADTEQVASVPGGILVFSLLLPLLDIIIDFWILSQSWFTQSLLF